MLFFTFILINIFCSFKPYWAIRKSLWQKIILEQLSRGGKKIVQIAPGVGMPLRTTLDTGLLKGRKLPSKELTVFKLEAQLGFVASRIKDESCSTCRFCTAAKRVNTFA